MANVEQNPLIPPHLAASHAVAVSMSEALVLSGREAAETATAMAEALILSGSEAALGTGEYDRARMLLALALRIDSHMETLRLDAALGRSAGPHALAPRVERVKYTTPASVLVGGVGQRRGAP